MYQIMPMAWASLVSVTFLATWLQQNFLLATAAATVVIAYLVKKNNVHGAVITALLLREFT